MLFFLAPVWNGTGMGGMCRAIWPVISVILSGDKPIVLRANAEKKFSKTSLLLRLQQGLHDFKYCNCAEFGMKYLFTGEKLWLRLK